MQEIHHRVKNNLQIVASLLNLQASRIKLPEAKAEFQSARDRIRALATLHRHLYAHGELQTINMRRFLTELRGQLFQALGETGGRRIQLESRLPNCRCSSDQVVPLALIVTEAVSNAVKYAFPDGRRGRISVRLVADEETARLVIEDDGIGIPAGQAMTENRHKGRSRYPAHSRLRAATERARLVVEEGQGTRYELRFPLRRAAHEEDEANNHEVARRGLRDRSQVQRCCERANPLSCEHGKRADKRLVGWRRHLHAHPELSLEECETAAFIVARLAELGVPFDAGNWRPRRGRHAQRAERSASSVGLRADMDALPIHGEHRPSLCLDPAGRDARLRT